MGPRPSVRGVEQRAGRKGPRASAWECLAVCSLTPRDRGRVLEQGWSISEAARQAAVSRQTASKWVARYRAGGQAGLQDRSTRPHRIPRRVPERVVRQIELLRRQRGATGSPERCISRARRSTGVLRRLGLQRLSRLEPVPDPNRYEWPHPGDLLQHLDTKELGRMGTTCPVLRRSVRRLVRRGAGWNIERLVCWTRSFGPRSGHSRDRLPPGSVQRRWSEGYFSSGGGRESNPPASPRPPTDFEGMSDARATLRAVTSVFVFGRRPRTCKDL